MKPRTSIVLALLMVVLLSGCSLFQKAASPGTDSEVSDDRSSADQNIYVEAVSKRDPALCTGIQDEMQRQRCGDVILRQEASINKNAEQCDQIADADMKQGCKDDLLFNEAGEKKDEAICARIGTTEKRDLCRANVRGLKEMAPPPAIPNQ